LKTEVQYPGKEADNLLFQKDLNTPAFVLQERIIRDAAVRLHEMTRTFSCRLLYAMKALALPELLHMMVDQVDGFSASSLFEARLGREILGKRGSIHLISPGLKSGEMAALSEVCDHIVFNSLPQWEGLRGNIRNVSCGLRINPQKSLVSNPRYNPCRPHSKLGIPLEQFSRRLADDPSLLNGINGLHFHTNCESETFEPWLETIKHIEGALSPHLSRLRWINLGGGYEFNPGTDTSSLVQAIDLLRGKYSLEVFIEPGLAFVINAGAVVTNITDLFDSDGKTIAILDTSTNHMPEVFEYDYHPAVEGEILEGEYRYILGGRNCLAGDLFGEYCFAKPLKVGDRIIFSDQAAYSLVKCNTFNGIPLPNVYILKEDGCLELIRTFSYQDYLACFGTTCGNPQ
jgi:carboxynorspermidine decarboxylase